MSPMKFRPITARGTRVAGRRASGGPEEPQGQGPAFDYGLNPDRAWVPSPEQIRMEVLRLTVRLQALRARPLEVRLADRTRTELFSLGVFAAARWTLGDTSERPLDHAPARVCNAEVEGQIRLARKVFDGKGDNWAEAFGVWMWLQWLTGAVDVLSYPEERHPQLARLAWPDR